MAWQAYVLTYRAVTPVAVGDGRLGFIQRVRPYIPGWTLWGAITAQLTRACLPRPDGADYEAVGGFVAANLPTSYAYILVDDADGKPAWPHYVDGRLHYGPLPAAEFEAGYLSSAGQTAIAPDTLSVAARTLHETEALAARVSLGQPVRWQVILNIHYPWREPLPPVKRLSPADVLSALQCLSVGGDRAYGLGRLERDDNPERIVEAGEGAWPSPLDWNWDNPERTLRAHAGMEILDGCQVHGQIEVIARRVWQNEAAQGAWGAGQKHIARALYAPGSQVDREGWQPAVGPLGVWQTAG